MPKRGPKTNSVVIFDSHDIIITNESWNTGKFDTPEPILEKKFSLKKSNLVLNSLKLHYLNLDLTTVSLQSELR